MPTFSVETFRYTRSLHSPGNMTIGVTSEHKFLHRRCLGVIHFNTLTSPCTTCGTQIYENPLIRHITHLSTSKKADEVHFINELRSFPKNNYYESSILFRFFS